MPLTLPPEKRLAVSIGPDFDAHSVWMGTFRSTSQSHLSRGEFGALVGVPRLLALFAAHGIRTTWCTPTHTLLTFPDQCAAIVAGGHEIAAHGVYHEPVAQLDPAEERRLMELQVKQHEQVLGRRPRGYRSPAWDITEHTLDLLEEFGFDWDSSLMGRDFEPYRPRVVTRIDPEDGNTFGPESRVLEIPVSWYLDDFPPLENLPRSVGMQSTDLILQRWTDQFTFAYERCPGGVFTLAVHPQTIARAHHFMMFEKFIEHVAQSPGVWFATLSAIADCWQDEDGR